MRYRTCILFVFWCFCFGKTHAQSNEITVEVLVDKVSHTNIRSFLQKTTEAVYKFYHDDMVNENCITSNCISVKYPDAEKTIITANDPAYSNLSKLKVFKMDPASGRIAIKMMTYKNNKGESCEYDKGDDYYFVSPLEIKLTELNPGVFSVPYTLVGKSEKFTSVIRVRYLPPVPANIKQDKPENVNDATKAVTLHSLVELTNKTNLTYLWEYKIGEDNTWKELGKTIDESVVFFPNRDIFKKIIKTDQTVQFRMKAVSPETQGPYSAPFTMQFTPDAPQIEKEDITLTATCPNTPSGEISIKKISGSAENFAYYVMKGKTVSPENYPDLISAANKIKAGTLPHNTPYAIQKLEEGDYTLVVYNANMPVGKIFWYYPFTISKYSVLTIKAQETKEATCAGVPDGQIMVETGGGDPGKLIYSISPAMGKKQQFGHTAIFTELTPGIYSVFVKDACSQLVATRELEIVKKTVQIKGKINIVTEPINNFSNGSVNIMLEGGSGQYKYVLTRGNMAESEKTATNASWVIDHLMRASYKIKVTDLNFPQCPGWDTSFVLSGKTLMADTTQQMLKKDSGQVAFSLKQPLPDIHFSLKPDFKFFINALNNHPGKREYFHSGGMAIINQYQCLFFITTGIPLPVAFPAGLFYQPACSQFYFRGTNGETNDGRIG